MASEESEEKPMTHSPMGSYAFGPDSQGAKDEPL